MAIKLPSLEGTRCVFFTACGEVETDDEKALKPFSGESRSIVARVGRGKSTRYVQLLRGQPSGKHCHVDVAAPANFDKGRPPKLNGTVADIQAILTPLVGAKIDLSIRATFEIPLEKLPVVISATRRLDTDLEGVSFRMTAGTLSITGMPICEIRWRIIESEQSAMITLEVGDELTIDESYLMNSFETCKIFFDKLVPESSPNGKN